MKIKYVVALTLILLCLITSFGCTESSDKISNPENTIKKYVSYFNGIQGDYIYDLLSADMKKRYSRDQAYNLVSGKRQAYKIYDHKITNKVISENTTTMDLEITWDIEGFHKTRYYKNIELVMEENEWKINSDVLRYSP